jgi:FtsX-like permease family
MGLGLIVGIAALGVISARAVVERRQQIGILRALGFRRRMIQLSFLIESSFIAVTAIFVGTGLGLIISNNVVNDVASQGGLGGPRARGAVAQPGDHLRGGICGGAPRHPRAGRARLAHLPGGGFAV